ncbi:MAG TPA: hypothetical protein VFV27_10050 [Nevskiaceae bacterium]|nr:hypothetical protein [Nevskiaceae bacterium]
MDIPSYSPAGDLQALTHNLGGSAQDVTFSYLYTAAHHCAA